MSAEALGGAVREAMERLRLGAPPSATEVAALREQTREVDRAIGALITPPSADEAR